MTRLVAIAFALFSAVVAQAAEYDPALAKRLGADERGMKQYVLVILKTGPNTALSKDERTKVFQGHMANIQRLAADGRLVLAGPFDENDKHYEGIFIFNVSTVAEAEPLIKADPAIVAGALAYEAFAWYGSAALQETSGIHARIQKPAP